MVLEVPTVAAFFRGERLRLAIACLLSTTATHVLLFQLLFRIVVPAAGWLVVGEVLALAVEATVYFWVSRRHDLARALMASAVANGLSFGFGLGWNPSRILRAGPV